GSEAKRGQRPKGVRGQKGSEAIEVQSPLTPIGLSAGRAGRYNLSRRIAHVRERREFAQTIPDSCPDWAAGRGCGVPQSERKTGGQPARYSAGRTSRCAADVRHGV